jgi:hypothetical protein
VLTLVDALFGAEDHHRRKSALRVGKLGNPFGLTFAENSLPEPRLERCLELDVQAERPCGERVRDGGAAKRPVLRARVRDGSDRPVGPDGGAVRGTQNRSCDAQTRQRDPGAMTPRAELERTLRRRSADEAGLRGEQGPDGIGERIDFGGLDRSVEQ